MNQEHLEMARKLLVELFRQRNNEFEQYGQYIYAPPTIQDALHHLEIERFDEPDVKQENETV
jgi:hypothetical protein